MQRKLAALVAALWLGVGAARVAAQSSSARVDGTIVVAGSGQPLGGVPVEILRAGVVASEARSDAAGRFHLPPLAPAAVELHIALDGYFEIREPLELRPRDTLDLTIELQPQARIEELIEVRGVVPQLDAQRTGSSRYLSRHELEAVPYALAGDVVTLAQDLVPGAVLGHDNFVHVRGNELSLHQFINGVSFLDNPHQQFFPGVSPRIFESVNMVTGGFRAEFGNRFGGILDITTRSGVDLGGRGTAALALGSVGTRRGSAEYGGTAGRVGYFLYGGAFHTDRYLNPPEREELHDEGQGARGTGQLDFVGARHQWKLLMLGGGSRFELPNTRREEGLGRDARRELDSRSAIASWQAMASSRTLISVALYARRVRDDLLPTSDAVTTFGDGSRTTRTTGLKADWYRSSGPHHLKAGVDIARISFLEALEFDSRELEAISFRGRETGHVVGVYLQDHVALGRNSTLDAGVRWDEADLLDTESRLSPRLGFAYRLPGGGSALRVSYSRLFTPPPIEYLALAGFLGNVPDAAGDTVGNPRAYRQNLIEAGWNGRLHHRLSLDLGLYRHTGRNAFENSEISNTRLFVPTNFARAHAQGVELGLELRPPQEGKGLSGRLDYGLAKVRFEGPVTGGLATEELAPGEEIPPAFDQRHTATASLFYRRPWRRLQVGLVARYGSGTPSDMETELDGAPASRIARLPGHLSADLSARLRLWGSDRRSVELEFMVTNVTDRRFRIAKESEVTPIQFAPRRTVSGRLRIAF